jgi:branched-chain amino acid transport system substrate-binding protein
MAKPVPPPPDQSTIPSQPPIPPTPEISSPAEDAAADAVKLRPPPLTAAEIGEGTRIAIMLPLSGRDADLGASMLRAAQLALFDIAGEQFILMPYDTEGDPDHARIAAAGAVRDGARLILGPLFSASVRAAAPVARAAGVNLVPFSNNRNVAGDGVFIVGLMPGDQVRRVIRYAASRGHLRFAALAPDTAYGRQVVEDAQIVASGMGGVLSMVEFFAADGSDLDATVRRLGRYDTRRNALLAQRKTLKSNGGAASTRRLARLKGVETLGEVGFDALLVPVGGARLKQIAALLPFYDIETSRTRLLGVSSWLTPGLGREPPLVGAWFAASRTEAGLDFERRYKELYGATPHDLAALAYDATALAAVLARGENGGDFSDIALTSPNGFAGTAGIFRFQANGQVQRGLAVLEVEPWQFREVSPSPETFEALSN